MAKCKWPDVCGCDWPPEEGSEFCKEHGVQVAAAIPMKTVRDGPYHATEAGDMSSVSGPYLASYLLPVSEQAHELAILLNLAYAAGEIHGKELALEIIVKEGSR